MPSPAEAFILTGWLANACAVAWVMCPMEHGDPEADYYLRHSLFLSMAPWACVLATLYALYLDDKGPL